MKGNIVDLKLRINSIKETAQITKAMQLISTAKLNKINEKYNKNINYLEKVSATIGAILCESGELTHRYFEKREAKHVTYVVIASDTGLAGDYNHRILNFAFNQITGAENKNVFTIGHMAAEFFMQKGIAPDLKFLDCAQDPTLDDAIKIARLLIKMFDGGLTDEVRLIYTENEKLTTQAVQKKLLPLERSAFPVECGEAAFFPLKFEPSKREVFDLLVPQYVIGLIYTAFIHAVRCEQTERMFTMNNANKNAKEMIDRLQIDYNGIRQALITTEITEISSTMLKKE